MTRRPLLVAALLILRLGHGTEGTQALELGNVLTGYTLASWREAEGLHLGRVAAIAQDPDGYLWLGTDLGLVRFDGLRFELLAGDADSALPSAPARSLLFGRDGRLWVGYAEGAGLYVFPPRAASAQRVELVRGSITALAEGADGLIWVGHDDGVARVVDGRWAPVEAFPGRLVQDFLAAPDGTLWVATMTGVLARAPGSEAFRPVADLSDAARDLSADAEGRLWSTHPAWGFRRVGAPAVRVGSSGRGNRLLHDRRGNLWVATVGQGLWRVRPGARDFVLERTTVLTGLLSDGVFALFEDREGNIWVGTQEGLNRLTPHTATPVTDLGVVRAVAVTPDDAVWAGSVEGLVRVSGVTSLSPGERTLWPIMDIQTLHVDRAGTLWIATRQGLLTMTAGRAIPVPVPGPALARITAMTSDERDGVWVADAGVGIARVRAGETLRQEIELPAGSRVQVMRTDRDGQLWLGLGSGAIVVSRAGGTQQLFGPGEGLPHTRISALVQDGSGRLWVGGTGGLSRFDGQRFVTIDTAQGLPRRGVEAVVEDRDGFLWVGVSQVGIIRLHPKEFDRAVTDSSYRIRYEHYDTTRGIAGLPISLDSQNAVRAGDGRLWFVTGRGLTVVEPQRIGDDWAPPPTAVRIEAVTADDRRLTATEGAALPAGMSRLRIDYTALSLTHPERVRFRYRLEGFDPEWVDVGTRRTAIFTNLAPGRYRFRVQARTSDGAWNESAQAWRFAIQPALHQTRVFQLGLLGLVAAGLWGGWRLRLRTVRREIALVFAERTRVSREIHDTLLQSLVGLALQLDVVARRLGAQPAERDQVTRIRRLVEDYIRDARQSIWDLRSSDLQALGLVNAMQRLGRRVTEEAGVRVDLTVTGRERACPPKVQMHLLRIAQEAMANAIRHGRAQGLHLELAFLDRSLRLSVVDDGCGFDPACLANLPDGHFGLAGMRERAEDVGGRFTVNTAQGEGTTIETVIPLPTHA